MPKAAQDAAAQTADRFLAGYGMGKDIQNQQAILAMRQQENDRQVALESEMMELRRANMELARLADKRDEGRYQAERALDPEVQRGAQNRNRYLEEQIVGAGQDNSLFPDRQANIRAGTEGQKIRNEGQRIENRGSEQMLAYRQQDRVIASGDRAGQRSAAFMEIGSAIQQMNVEAGDDEVLKDSVRQFNDATAKLLQGNPQAAKYIVDSLPQFRNSFMASKFSQRAERYTRDVEKWVANGTMDPEAAKELTSGLQEFPEEFIPKFEARRDVQNQETARAATEARHLARVQTAKAELEARAGSQGGFLSPQEEDALFELDLAEAQLINDKLTPKEMRDLTTKAFAPLRPSAGDMERTELAGKLAKDAAGSDDYEAFWDNFEVANEKVGGTPSKPTEANLTPEQVKIVEEVRAKNPDATDEEIDRAVKRAEVRKTRTDTKGSMQ